jgi:putative hydrolase of the HAD superfamily
LELRAVIFDFGMVLSSEPDQAAHAELLRLSGIPAEQLDSLYWKYRHAYDEGALSGLSYWRQIASDAGLTLDEARIAELAECDARMWTTANPAMVHWALTLKASGLRIAILSNIGDVVQISLERHLRWVADFDVRVWSHQLRLAKPDPAIYAYTLRELGVAPAEALFIDDREVNIESARAMGIRAIHFTGIAALKEELLALGLAAQVPLPDEAAASAGIDHRQV